MRGRLDSGDPFQSDPVVLLVDIDDPVFDDIVLFEVVADVVNPFPCYLRDVDHS